MKKAIFIAIVLTVTNSFGQKIRHSHFSIVPSLATDGEESRNLDYNFSFNLFVSTVRNIEGFEIGSFYNRNEGKMAGFQISGLLNITKDSVSGYQIAGISNISGSVKGLQQSGINNYSKDVRGVQLAGITNIAGDVAGVQISGILNRAKVLNGIQIGLINVADSVKKGGAIGLINVVRKNGYREVEFSTSDYQNIGFSYKSGAKHLYSILTVGYNFFDSPLQIAGLGLGGVFAISRGWYLKPEVLAYNYTDNPFDSEKSANSYHIRFGLMRKIGKVGITIMPSVHYAKTERNTDAGMLAISSIKSFAKNKVEGFGFGLGIGIALLK